jgi:hypothetical protein
MERIFSMKRHQIKLGFYGAAVMFGVMALSSCSRAPIDRAIRRELLPSEANVVVATHCQGCHVHSQFRAERHMAAVKLKFPAKSAFRQARDCLECHDLRLKGLIFSERRGTSRPHGRLLTMINIPKPRGAVPLKRGKKTAGAKTGKKTEKKKERKWYFFYLF